MRADRRVLLLLPLLPACSAWWFSGVPVMDRTRPAVLLETTGGIEYGCATELGVLTLGRTANHGPCRVHYFLGDTPMVETGSLEPTEIGFAIADIDLKTPAIRIFDRQPRDARQLLAMWTADGEQVTTVSVQLATGGDIEGDLLLPPGTPLPAGAAILNRVDGQTLEFVGLVTGKATLEHAGSRRDYYVFAGRDRLRELLAIPTEHPRELLPKFRPDDITVQKPAGKAPPRAAVSTQEAPR
jgi:hypothetical protein